MTRGRASPFDGMDRLRVGLSAVALASPMDVSAELWRMNEVEKYLV